MGAKERARVLQRLGRGPATLSQLAGPSGLTLNGIKKHVGILEFAGLVETEKVGECASVGWARPRRSVRRASGSRLVLLGAWGALIPFIGPYFHYAYTPSHAWVGTSGRFWLEIVPGAAAALGGLILLASANRALAAFGAWLAALAGAWFVIGPALSTVWASSGFPQIGVPVGGTLLRAAEQIGFFAGLGAAIIFFGALALGRMAVVGARDVQLAAASAPGAPLAAATAPGARRAAAGAAGTDAAHRRKETSMPRGFKTS